MSNFRKKFTDIDSDFGFISFGILMKKINIIRLNKLSGFYERRDKLVSS